MQPCNIWNSLSEFPLPFTGAENKGTFRCFKFTYSYSFNRPTEGNRGLNRIKKLSNEHDFSVFEYGELPASQISKELAQCDFGVSTTPYDVIGKSGATAAMFEHRLPVIVYDDGDTPAEKLFVLDEFSDQIYFLDSEELVSKLVAFFNKKRKPFFDGVAYAVKQMLELTS